VQEGGVDYADYGAVVHDEADGDAVEGGEVGEVYGSWGWSGVRFWRLDCWLESG
jgi:hypothetical protein